MPTDEKRLLELVRQLKAGNQDAFEEFYALTKKTVFFAGYSLSPDRELIADITQETYEDFLRNISSFRESETVSAYLVRMMHNKMVNELLRRNREVPIDTYLNEDNEQGEEDDSGEEEHELFALAKKLLSAEEYQIVILHVVNDQKFNAIAKILNKPLGTILWVYNKAMKKLKKELGKEEEK
jgi:RNA polymerase sigma-70 factor (ECF subfamily)